VPHVVRRERRQLERFGQRFPEEHGGVGTTAMSTDQWAAYDGACATPATSEAYNRLVALMQDVHGYQYILPTR
jgi:hypothetical protein